jgi:hypothetical protein
VAYSSGVSTTRRAGVEVTPPQHKTVGSATKRLRERRDKTVELKTVEKTGETPPLNFHFSPRIVSPSAFYTPRVCNQGLEVSR